MLGVLILKMKNVDLSAQSIFEAIVTLEKEMYCYVLKWNGFQVFMGKERLLNLDL